MKLARTFQITAAAAACAVTALPAALAGGEAKNSPPFTRPEGSASTEIISAQFSTARAFPAEPKNGTPFTRRAGENGVTVYARQRLSRLASAITTAESKNEWPFTGAVYVNR